MQELTVQIKTITYTSVLEDEKLEIPLKSTGVRSRNVCSSVHANDVEQPHSFNNHVLPPTAIEVVLIHDDGIEKFFRIILFCFVGFMILKNLYVWLTSNFF